MPARQYRQPKGTRGPQSKRSGEIEDGSSRGSHATDVRSGGRAEAAVGRDQPKAERDGQLDLQRVDQPQLLTSRSGADQQIADAVPLDRSGVEMGWRVPGVTGESQANGIPLFVARAVLVCTPNTGARETDAMRRLTFGMNVSLDGYIAAPGDDLGWSVPSDELFQWWSDRVGATDLALYGRRLWETMSSHWPTADQQPGATPAQIEFARRWRDMPKMVFSSTTSAVDSNARLVTGDAVTEIIRLKTEDGGPMDIGGATLAAAAMRAGLVDEYAIATHPVLVGSGTPFFTALDDWVNLDLVETRTFPAGVLLTRYETRR